MSAEIEAPEIIRLECPFCGQHIEVPSTMAWETVGCAACKKQVPIVPPEHRAAYEKNKVERETPFKPSAGAAPNFEDTGLRQFSMMLIVLGGLAMLIGAVAFLGILFSNNQVAAWPLALGSLGISFIFFGVLFLIYERLCQIHHTLKNTPATSSRHTSQNAPGDSSSS